jgi:hypothetical protein
MTTYVLDDGTPNGWLSFIAPNDEAAMVKARETAERSTRCTLLRLGAGGNVGAPAEVRYVWPPTASSR